MNPSAPNARTEQIEIDASARWPVLAFFGSDQQGGRPGQSYTPPSMKDGRIEPGRIK